MPSAEAKEIFREFCRGLEPGDDPDLDSLLARHPEHSDELRRRYEFWMRFERAVRPLEGSLFHRPEEKRHRSRSLERGHREFESGSRVGEFVLGRVIGEGGMGTVWMAEQAGLDRPVALKLIRSDRLSARSIEYFRREGRAAGRVRHPGIVAVYAAGEVDGVHYLAEELVEGECTLVDFLHEMRSLSELPTGYYERLAEFFAQLADALQAAHDAGVIHRDLKPQNILVTPDDRPKVTDFGLARIEEEASLSVTGEFAGTYYYMSPEQVTARRVGIDHRTDIFSLGVMLYEAVTLVRPFDGDTGQQVANKIVFEDPDDPLAVRSRAPRDLAVIAMKCLEKSPGRRYATMADLGADLRRFISHETILARPPGPVQRARRWTVRHPAITSTLAVAAIALVALSALYLQNERTKSQLEERLEEVLRLSASRDLNRLEEQVDSLWPAVPARIADYEAWVAAAEELIAEIDDHRAKRDELRAGAERDEATGQWRFASAEDEWWHDELTNLVERLDRLVDPQHGLLDGQASLADEVPPPHGWGIRRRLAAARRIAELHQAAGQDAGAWRDAREAIESSPLYGGLVLEPQVGLVPIGPDRRSGLWEFWHVASGEEVERRLDGTLVFGEDSGIVLVLVPPGEFAMGAQASDPNGLNYDPHADGDEVPIRAVSVPAFFLSKFEMTQAQWEGCTGDNPSGYRPLTTPAHYARDGNPVDLTNPIENVTWAECTRVLERLDLVLPTESQWEYAARAGTATPRWTGDDPTRLATAANVGDRYAIEANAVGYETWDDGRAVHGPVGNYEPNPFGLHNMLGNVREWCRDIYSVYGAPPTGTRRVMRGAAFNDAAFRARSANRNGQEDQANPSIGVRPARELRSSG